MAHFSNKHVPRNSIYFSKNFLKFKKKIDMALMAQKRSRLVAFGEPGLGGGRKGRRKLRKMTNRQLQQKQRLVAQPEVKFRDYGVTSAALTAAMAFIDDGTGLALNAIAQGDDYNNRDGRKINLKSIHVRGYVNRPAVEIGATPQGDELVRIILYWDKQCNGQQGTSTQIVTTGGTTDVTSLRDIQYTKRYKVLKDIIVPMEVNPAGVAADNFAVGPIRRFFNFNVKNLNIPVRFNSTGGTVTAITDNAIHLIACNTNAAVDGNWTVIYTSRVRFTDL